MSFTERIHQEFKQMSARHLLNCISTLFILLSLLIASSIWLANTDTSNPIALPVHIALIILSFFSVVFIATKNQKKQNLNSQQHHKAQEILYNITSTVNNAHELKELLTLFCKKTNQELEAKNVSVWLITENNWLEFIAGSGIDPIIVSQSKRIKITNELADTLINNTIIHDNQHVTRLAEILQCDISDDDRSYYLPLHNQSHTLGVIRIKLNQRPLGNEADLYELFSTLAIQLCNAIEKAKQDQESRRMIIMQERSLIANELHDSLAQTLASLRFQVRVLDETLQPTSEFQSIRGIEQVENSLDEAYSDLRELIAHCRTPIDKQGLMLAVEKLISRMRKDSGMHILLQREWENSDLPPNLEMHIFRIVQEAMNNITKHANASNIVLNLFKSASSMTLHISDNGCGFDMDSLMNKKMNQLDEDDTTPRCSFGLSSMRERAESTNGKFNIDSTPGRGTSVVVSWDN